MLGVYAYRVGGMIAKLAYADDDLLGCHPCLMLCDVMSCLENGKVSV